MRKLVPVAAGILLVLAAGCGGGGGENQPRIVGSAPAGAPGRLKGPGKEAPRPNKPKTID